MGRRSRIPTPMEIEVMTCPLSGPQSLYFPYNWDQRSYSMGNFNPQFTNGQITDQDCRSLLADINGCPLTKTACDWGFLFIIGGLLLMAGCLPAFIVTLARDSSIYLKELNVDMGLGLAIIILGGMRTLSVNLCVITRRSYIRNTARDQAIQGIVKRHNEATFFKRQATAKPSPNGGYVAVQFLWLAPPLDSLADCQPLVWGTGQRVEGRATFTQVHL